MSAASCAGMPTARAAAAIASAGSALLLMRDRHRDHAAREAGEIAQEARAVLGRQHADDQHQRPRHALLEIGERGGDGAAAVGIVAAVEPQLAAGRQQRGELALRRRCMRAGHSALAMPVSNASRGSCKPRGAQRRDGDAGIVELMAAEELRRRQIEQAVVVLIDEPAALLGRGPVLAGDPDRRVQARGLALDHRERLARLRGHDQPARRA